MPNELARCLLALPLRGHYPTVSPCSGDEHVLVVIRAPEIIVFSTVVAYGSLWGCVSVHPAGAFMARPVVFTNAQ